MPAPTNAPRSTNLLHGWPILAALGVPLALSETLRAAPARAWSTGQIFQGFDGRPGEDASAFRRDERAIWGRNSALTATSHFLGDGGPGGDFDRTIRSGETFTLDTTFFSITNEQQTATQSVIDGFVNVRNPVVQPDGILVIRGPNPCRIAVSGDLRVEGEIIADGEDHRGVFTFHTGLPSLGTVGGPGGGRGGSSGLLSTQSTPAGEAGYGAWNTPFGGGGGENTSGVNRVGSAGGGGSGGHRIVQVGGEIDLRDCASASPLGHVGASKRTATVRTRASRRSLRSPSKPCGPRRCCHAWTSTDEPCSWTRRVFRSPCGGTSRRRSWGPRSRWVRRTLSSGSTSSPRTPSAESCA